MATIEELKKQFDGGSAQERFNAIYSLLEMGGIKAEEAKEFADSNSAVIGRELRTLGFSLDNPLIQFLMQYNKSKKTIDVFFVPENWIHIHNAYANGVLDTKQLNFTCAEVDKPKLLLNDNFWNRTQDMDKDWYIKLWEWCSSQSTKDEILNKYVKILFSNINLKDIANFSTEGGTAVADSYLNYQKILKNIDNKLNNVDFTTLKNAEMLRKGLFFSTALLEYNKEIDSILSIRTTIDNQIASLLKNQPKRVDETDLLQLPNGQQVSYERWQELVGNNERQIEKMVTEYADKLVITIARCQSRLSADSISPESAPLISTKQTNEIIKALNQNVTLSNRDVLGKYQKVTGDQSETSSSFEKNKDFKKSDGADKHLSGDEINRRLKKVGLNTNMVRAALQKSDAGREKRALSEIVDALNALLKKTYD